MAFLGRANGGEGSIDEQYVRLWRAEELIEMNLGYNVVKVFFPNLFLIGTDGGGGKLTPSMFLPVIEGYSRFRSSREASDARPVADSSDSFVGALDIPTEQGQCIMRSALLQKVESR